MIGYVCMSRRLTICLAVVVGNPAVLGRIELRLFCGD